MNPYDEALKLLNLHSEIYHLVESVATKHGHPNPVDTRAWSQILVSTLVQISGLERKKGADFSDGSDVKAACTWGAIDTPRFNGCIKAGTKSSVSGNMSSLDAMPYLFFVLWDHKGSVKVERCRIWVVRPQHDAVFRAICADWYSKREDGTIVSNNFQLHPPRNQDSNIIRNTCGTLSYPLYFSAVRTGKAYVMETYSPNVLLNGQCAKA